MNDCFFILVFNLIVAVKRDLSVCCQRNVLAQTKKKDHLSIDHVLRVSFEAKRVIADAGILLLV